MEMLRPGGGSTWWKARRVAASRSLWSPPGPVPAVCEYRCPIPCTSDGGGRCQEKEQSRLARDLLDMKRRIA